LKEFTRERSVVRNHPCPSENSWFFRSLLVVQSELDTTLQAFRQRLHQFGRPRASDRPFRGPQDHSLEAGAVTVWSETVVLTAEVILVKFDALERLVGTSDSPGTRHRPATFASVCAEALRPSIDIEANDAGRHSIGRRRYLSPDKRRSLRFAVRATDRLACSHVEKVQALRMNRELKLLAYRHR